MQQRPDTPVGLTYLVSGWYDDPKDDILYGSANTPDEPQRWQKRMQGLSWAWYPESAVVDDVPPPPPDPQPTRTITHGFVSSIEWKGRAFRYNYGPGGNVSPELAAGNTSLEALAALLIARDARDGEDPATLETLERVLLAFQNDLLNVFDKHAPASAIERELDELLHAASFGSKHGGTSYEIVRKDADSPAGAGTEGKAAAAIDLPAALGEALATLNETQRQLEATEAELASVQQSYYLAWHQQADGISVPSKLLEDLDLEITREQARKKHLAAGVQTAREAARKAVEELLPAYTLSSRPRNDTGSRRTSRCSSPT